MPRKKAPAAPVSLYSLHPSFAMGNARFDNIPKRTGKTVAEWVELVKRYGPPTEKEQRLAQEGTQAVDERCLVGG